MENSGAIVEVSNSETGIMCVIWLLIHDGHYLSCHVRSKCATHLLIFRIETNTAKYSSAEFYKPDVFDGFNS